MLSSFVKVMVANEALSSPFLVHAWLTPQSSLVWVFFFLVFYCGFWKWKLSGFLPVVIVIVIFAGNYSSFSAELIHTCHVCYRGAYQRSFGGSPSERHKWPFHSWRRRTRAFVRHPHTSISLCFYLFHTRARTHSPSSPPHQAPYLTSFPCTMAALY